MTTEPHRKGALHHIAYFKTLTHRGLETFQLMVQSEDLRLDLLLRNNIRQSGKLTVIEGARETVVGDGQIGIFDCRSRFPSSDNADPHGAEATFYAKIALINPDFETRREVYMVGFADFICWPFIEAELSARIVAQCRSLSMKGPKYTYSNVDLVEQCCKYLVTDLARHVSIQALADRFNTNHNTLTKLFNQEVGQPPLAWLRQQRIEGAARVLRETQLPIGIVASDFGYDLPGNFATAFRRHIGMTPYEYRQSERRKK